MLERRASRTPIEPTVAGPQEVKLPFLLGSRVPASESGKHAPEAGGSLV